MTYSMDFIRFLKLDQENNGGKTNLQVVSSGCGHAKSYNKSLYHITRDPWALTLC